MYITTPARRPKNPRVKPIQEKSCGIILFREEASTSEDTHTNSKSTHYYLVLHYPGGHWDFAKGHVEANENEEMTALREMREETGIFKVTFMKNFRVAMDYFYRRDRRLYHKDVIYFLGKTSEQKVKLSHEHQGYAWLTYADAMKQLTFENAKSLLKKAEKFLVEK